MDNIYPILTYLMDHSEPCALATITSVDGSSYRKKGTTMLFTPNGEQIGVLSAGCLEADLAIRAQELLSQSTNHAMTLDYDMRAEDDLSWGRGAGCNGVIHILLETIGIDERTWFLKLKKYLQQGIPVTLYKRVWQQEINQAFFPVNQQPFGDQQLINNIQQGHLKKNGETMTFINKFRPQMRLIIFGAGPDVDPLVTMAEQAGFQVLIWDWREANLTKDRFPTAQLMTGNIPSMLEADSLHIGDMFIIMTHDFQKDKTLLHHLPSLETLPYLGILGSAKRTKRLLNSKTIPANIHTPVGMDIGADGPFEIAISIIADLIRTRSMMTDGGNERGGDDYWNLSCSRSEYKVWKQ